MNYIATALYSLLKGEEELTFELMVALIAKGNLTALFIEGVPDFHLRTFVFEKLLKIYKPAIYLHLNNLEIITDMITGNWFMTLFTNFLSFGLVMPIMDNFILEGWVAIYRIALGMICFMELDIMNCKDVGDIAILLREMNNNQKIEKALFHSIFDQPLEWLQTETPQLQQLPPIDNDTMDEGNSILQQLETNEND
jgi:hypothetical protein